MKKSQAALEYLVVYGWAILAIVIVAAILWYFGIFNPEKYHQCVALDVNETSLGRFTCVTQLDASLDCKNIPPETVKIICDGFSIPTATPVSSPTPFACVVVSEDGSFKPC